MNFGKYLFTSKQKKSSQYEIGLFKKVAILAVCYFHSYTVAQCVFCRVVHIIGKALIGVLRPPHSPPPPLLSTEQHLNSYRKF